MKKLDLDFETRSRVDLKKVGLWAYALHPSTEVLCLGLGSDKGVTVLRKEDVKRLAGTHAGALLQPDLLLSAHNAPFEYAIYNLILHRRYGWPALWDTKRWRCTMAKALACGLPGDLDTLGRVLRIKTPKDIDGRRVMMQLCKPQVDGTFNEDPALLERLYRYNATDVQAEIEVDALLPDLSADEQKVWELDLEINRRGVAVDLQLAAKAAVLSETLVEGLNKNLCTLTNGKVDKATQVTALKYYLKDHHGIERDSLDKENIVDLMLDPTLPAVVQEVLSARRQVGKKTSVSKYKAALEQACPDGRVRGLLQYHAAHTGRWGGRGLQPQNFPKGWDKPVQQATAVNDINNLPAEQFLAKYGNRSMDVLSDTLRGLFVAAPGKTLVCGDFNAIEARVLFWLAGEEEALTAYRRGDSPYLSMAKTIYPKAGLPDTVEEAKKSHPQEYDIGKRTILGCGYGMGWRKFRDNIYTETAKKGKPILVSDELAQRAVGAYREKYARVKGLWKEVEHAAVLALDSQGRAIPCAGGRVLWGMSADRRFLACKLPSGRFLRYWKPAVVEGWRIFCEDDKCVHWKEMDEMKCPTRTRVRQLAYQGVNSFTKQWGHIYVYGGLLVENIDQAISRDLLVHGMMNVAAAKMDPALTIHDEVLSEVDSDPTGAWDDRDTLDDFIALLCKTPEWAKGCPVAAEGWVGGRYHK